MAKILIVEDNDDNRVSLTRWLQSKGFEVATAKDGREGVATTQAEKPDLVLMDMNMPVLDGWEATQQIKACMATRYTPVIAFSAHGMPDDRARALGAGCCEYLTKPVDLVDLLAHIKDVLAR